MILKLCRVSNKAKKRNENVINMTTEYFSYSPRGWLATKFGLSCVCHVQSQPFFHRSLLIHSMLTLQILYSTCFTLLYSFLMSFPYLLWFICISKISDSFGVRDMVVLPCNLGEEDSIKKYKEKHFHKYRASRSSFVRQIAITGCMPWHYHRCAHRRSETASSWIGPRSTSVWW